LAELYRKMTDGHFWIAVYFIFLNGQTQPC